MKIRISDDLVLGADLVVSTAGIFATKGQGKSHLAQVMAEEMLSQGQVLVAIDPTDAWHGLRSSADGKSEGYPVVVIGGDHGDLRLEPGAAVQLAEAVVSERFSCVICTDGLSDLAETKFVREFLDTIYRRNREPIHIFVDEADVFAPQKPFDVEDARCIRAMSHVVRRGRKKGIGTTLITQRPAELNASVRTMVDMLFVLGMSHNLDIDAVEKWLRLRKKKQGDNSAFALQEEMIASLDSLQRGDAWVWAPRLKIHSRFRARAKRTFDSGATPKPGQKVKAPKKLAAVDLQRLGQAMAAAVQRQKENDPAELKKQVAALRRELDNVQNSDTAESANCSETAALRARVAELEVQVAAARDLAVGAAAVRRLESLVEKVDELTAGSRAMDEHLADLRRTAAEIRDAARHAASVPGPAPGVTSGRRRSAGPPVEVATSRANPAPTPRATNGHAVVPPAGLKPAHLRLLSAVAWWESLGVPDPDYVSVAFAAGTSAESSAFENNRSRLRAAGYIDYPPGGGRVRLTDAGRQLAPQPTRPRTNAAMQEMVFARLKPAVGRLLRVLVDAYPVEVSYEDLAERAGTSHTSSAFENNRSWLRARGLADYPRKGFVRATMLLFPETMATDLDAGRYSTA